MDLETYARFVVALVAVLALIAAIGWALRRFGLGGGAGLPGRARRLVVVESLSVDGKSRLALVRRDGVEHLVLIGPNASLLVETGIVPATPPEANARP